MELSHRGQSELQSLLQAGMFLEEQKVEDFPIRLLIGVLSQIMPGKQIQHYCSVNGR
jgi:hypothetical protein